MNDLSWMPLMGMEFIITAGAVAAVFVISRWGLPAIREIIQAKLAAKKEASCAAGLQSRHEARLESIEGMLREGAEGWKRLHSEWDARMNSFEQSISDLSDAIEDAYELGKKASIVGMENTLFKEGGAPFKKLRAFRRLLALGKNGRVKEAGMKLVVQHKEIWRDVMETELGVEVASREYYDAAIAEIERRVFEL